MVNTQRLKYLFDCYFNEIETREEKLELMNMVQEVNNEEEINAILDDARNLFIGKNQLSEERSERIFNAIMKTDEKEQIIPITNARSRKLWRWTAAAAAILILFVSVSYFLSTRNDNKQPIASFKPEPVINDVKAPISNRATVTLSNGQQVLLDSLNNGSMLVQNNVTLKKFSDGRIAYEGLTKEIIYNTLTNPRGSKVIDMALADGSHVWLNAGSSIKYPITFIGNERRVEITGEAYFEVTHNPRMPFAVTNKETTVQVLGTHFNVNAYDDESDIRITLLQGSVKVNKYDLNVILKPGQQAMVNDQIKVLSNIDTEEVIAWKNGEFQFGDKSDIGNIMRQIARWYNVEIIYQGQINKHFGGAISRNVNISDVLNIMQKTGGVKFKIEGNKVTVLP